MGVAFGGPTDSRGCILAATDLTDPALPSIAHAIHEAKRNGARVVAMHVVAPRSTRWEANNAARASASASLHAALTNVDVPTEVRIGTGPVVLTIAAALEELQPRLLVMSAGPRAGAIAGAHGEIVDAVAGDVACSVLIVRLLRKCTGWLARS